MKWRTPWPTRRSAGPTGKGPIARCVHFVTHDVWMIEVGDSSRVRALLTRVSRVLLIASRDFVRDRCMQQSAALTYLTIFTLPALLALMFTVAKGMNAFETLQAGPVTDFLDYAFPLEAGGGSARIREVVGEIFAYVEEADLAALGTVGILFLIYAALKMLASVEASFNEIWGVQRSRTLVRKLADYLAIVIVVPVVLLVGTGFTTFLASETVSSLVGGEDVSPLLSHSVPLVAICLGMTLVLLTLPNTRVRLLPALAGGIVAGLAWQLAQVAFVDLQLGLTRANAVFSSFAAVPLLLSWIYLSWVTVFVGAELSYAIQNERAITSFARTGVVDQRFREALAPRLVGRIVAAFLSGATPPHAAQLGSELGVPPRTVAAILEALCAHRILVGTNEDRDEGFLPARDPQSITVHDLLVALRHTEGVPLPPSKNGMDEQVDRILGAFDDALAGSLENRTLRELALALEGAGDLDAGVPDMPGARVAEEPRG